MKTSFLIWATSLLTAVSNAHPTPNQMGDVLDVPDSENRTALEEAFSREAIHKLMSRQQQQVAVTGAQGNIQARYEIRQLHDHHPKQFDLFILAMQQFQNMPSSQTTSYFQVAGIHGVPRVSWNGVNPEDGCSDCANADGYCTHDIPLFPAWHRAYMALFEQQFVALAQQIASQYSGSQRQDYINAAATIRFPYWDWAANPPSGRTAFPRLISDAQTTINGPNGLQTINNPIYSYRLADTSGLIYSPFTNWQNTARYPNSNGQSNDGQENSVFGGGSGSSNLRSQVFSMFSNCKDYLPFSNDAVGSSACNSLEGIHNDVHTLTGGPGTGSGDSYVSGGHMTYLPEAAFDPIFWLHHCNVDRLFAMWQTINPNSYGASGQSNHNTWVLRQGEQVDANTALKPFRSDTNGNFWTTNNVRNWAQTFKYTYPEFVDSKGDSGAINSYVNALYGTATATAGSSKRTASSEASPVDALPSVADALATNTPVLASVFNDLLHYSNGSSVQYVANMHIPRYALNGSYTVYMFNGQPACEDPDTFMTDPSLITPVGVPAMPGMSSKLMTSRSIPITDHLTGCHKSGDLTDLHIDSVSSYLGKNMDWRIVGPDGNCVDASKLDGFQVGVFASSMSPITCMEELPTWSDFLPLPNITDGKCGGAQLGSAVFDLTHIFTHS
ncbi:Hypothetical protein R9X50_00174000 [Acrodontium crateriforme]|uniref:tyrosinase n=1 Tax=Acrodontium crateriforme TaxID=150365 RepID=A0AAQ3LZL9_9PEZI|nr:Hypothetical protein R9X50_00174000 [Acrodontium crateriforme]